MSYRSLILVNVEPAGSADTKDAAARSSDLGVLSSEGAAASITLCTMMQYEMC